MAESKLSLFKRILSGLLAAIILVGSYFVYGSTGLLFFSSLMIVLGIREFARMAFVYWKMPDLLSHAYLIIALTGFVLMFRWPDQAAKIFALTCVLFMVISLWITRGKVTNENLLAALALGVFGLVYCVLFPLYSLRIIYLENGERWFLFLLLLVFTGDTFAYFFGRWFGGPKFMPMVSPNKTWSGSLGGLLGSVLAGELIVALLLPDVPVGKAAVFCLFCGAAAQSGDLLMSLVKRVAHVKDSGSIMPGHGGILDRLDGVFIACPLVHAFALYVMV